MQFPLKIKELCTPSKIYLFISLIGLVVSLFQNLLNFNNNSYKCGSYEVIVPSVILIFFFKFVYVVFWAYILNLICKDNKKNLAWLLVLFPFILLFVIIGILMLTGGKIVRI